MLHVFPPINTPKQVPDHPYQTGFPFAIESELPVLWRHERGEEYASARSWALAYVGYSVPRGTWSGNRMADCSRDFRLRHR